MEGLNTRLRGGGTHVWIALAAIVGIFALVLSTLVVASPTASAQETTAESYSDNSDSLQDDTATDKTEPDESTASEVPSDSETPAAAPSEEDAPTSDGQPELLPRILAANESIEVNVTSIEGVPNAGEQLEVGEKAKVTGTWDATNANPKPGDSFTVGFPEQLKIPAGSTFSLFSEDNESYGLCTVSADNSFTCVLNDNVTGKDDVSGTWFVEATATEYTDAETLDFTVPGGKVTVPLPGDNGGISDGTELDFKKQGAVQPDQSSIRWTVDIPGSMLAALETPNDGSVSLNDQLPAGLQVCDPNRDPKLSVGRTEFQEIDNGLSLTPGATGKIGVGIEAGAPFQNDQIYRVEYTTCTTNKGVLTKGEYKNQFFVGDESQSGTVGYDGFKPLELNKSGSVLNGLDGIEWTINIPGNAVNEDGTVNLSDTLGGDQKICEGGVNLKVQQATDLIVWPATQRVYTDAENVGGVNGLGTEGGNAFSTTITGLKHNDALVYKVTYKTCLDAIPDRGTPYSNSATVNNNPVSDKTNAPNPQARKDGVLNKKPVTIGDVEYPAGTTQTWTVTIPGYELETTEGQPSKEINATDVIDSTAGVCGETGDLKDRLNLKVLGKGVGKYAPDVDLTDKTEVTPGEGNSFSLVTQRADEKDFSRARNYVISYTTCTSSGGQDSQGTEYGNVFNYGKEILKKTVKQDWNAGGTASGVSKGSFSLLKGNTTDSKPFGKDLEFTVGVEEFAPGKYPGGEAEKTYDIKVKADGTPVSGQFVRGNGWTIRLTEKQFPNGSGFLWEKGTFLPSQGVTVDDEGRAVVTITPKSNVQVQLNNTAKLGEVTVKKEVINNTGGDLSAEQTFNVTAWVDPDGDGPQGSKKWDEFNLKNGQIGTAKELPIGAIVTFKEEAPANTDSVTWGEPKFDPEKVVVSQETTGSVVKLTNTANKTQGTFSIKKDLKVNDNVPDDATIPKSFVVNASWTDANGEAQTKPLTVSASGEVTEFGRQLPAGTVVTLEEVLPENGGKVQWADPSFSGGGVKIVDGKAQVTIGLEPVKVTVKNIADLNDGTLRLTKLVSGEAAEAVTKDVKFEVEASWKLPGATDYSSKTLTVHNDEIVDLGVKLPVGTEVTFKEISQGAADKVQWGTINWGTDPSGATWLKPNADGTATGIVSDDPTIGRLITLTNEALWKPGAVSFEKLIATDEGDISVKDAVDKGIIPDTVEFKVKIKDIQAPTGKALPENAGIKTGDEVALNKSNDWAWTSEKVLPKGTKVIFDEVTPTSLPGIDWGQPLFDSDTVEVGADETSTVTIKNTPIPTTPVDVDKSVTGPKGKDVEKDESSTFQVKATWQVEGQDKTCILNVVPGKSAAPAEGCQATVIDGKVYFPRNTEITFEEIGQKTDVPNVKWQEVLWTVAKGDAKVEVNESEDDTKAPTATVTITGDKDVTIGLENKTSSNGLIIIPIPIPLPPFHGGSSNPPTPNTPVTPGTPVNPGKPGEPTPGKPGHPGKPLPQSPSKSDQAQSAKGSSSQKGLARTGANVLWLAGGALLLLAAGAFLITRNKKRDS